MIPENPAAHLKYCKRKKPIRPTRLEKISRRSLEDIRNQPFNARANESADFVEFIGLVGLGHLPRRSPDPGGIGSRIPNES
jgi:hypothetical protein